MTDDDEFSPPDEISTEVIVLCTLLRMGNTIPPSRTIGAITHIRTTHETWAADQAVLVRLPHERDYKCAIATLADRGLVECRYTGRKLMRVLLSDQGRIFVGAPLTRTVSPPPPAAAEPVDDQARRYGALLEDNAKLRRIKEGLHTEIKALTKERDGLRSRLLVAEYNNEQLTRQLRTTCQSDGYKEMARMMSEVPYAGVEGAR